MTDARRQEDWAHTAWLAAMIANANRDTKKRPRPFQPRDFNPMLSRDARKARATRVTGETLAEFRQAFSHYQPTRRRAKQ